MNAYDLSSKVYAVALLCTLFAAESVSAATYGYTGFEKTFVYGPGVPTNLVYTTQTVEAQSNAAGNAYARCTKFTYSGSQPVLTIKSLDSKYPVNSVSFTGTGTDRAMKYTDSIPTDGKYVKFQGKVTYDKNASFDIIAAVKA